MILALPLMAASVWAQGQFGAIPKTVDASDVEVTEVRYLQYQYFGSNAVLYSYKYPSVDANGNKVVLSALMGLPTKIFVGGVLASPNNLIIGCHETITSNYECPTNYNHGGAYDSGNGMLLEYCRNDVVRQPCCLVILADYEGYGCTADRPHPYLYQELTARQVVDAVRYGLALYATHVGNDFAGLENDWRSVCIGYSQGGSVSLATHKFIETNGLSEELHFAGSVCGDGPYDPIAHLRYYMEDNGRTYDLNRHNVEEKTNHTPGTISMPIVMPLILKGMCDSNPLMRQHNLTEYLTDRFFATSSTFMLESKSQPNNDDQYSTGRVGEVYRDCKNNGKSWTGKVNNPYGDDFTVGGSFSAGEMAEMLYYDDGDNVWGKMEYMLTPVAYSYFTTKSNFEDTQGNRITPTGHGVMQDLHRALESNNLTVGWTPKHRVAFYHSTYDTVVPYANLLSFIKNQSSLKYFFYDESYRHEVAGLFPPSTTTNKSEADVFVYETPAANDHVAAGSDFYFYGSALYIVGESPDYWLYKWVLTGDN